MTTARARKHAEMQLAIAQRSVRFWERKIARLEAGPHPLNVWRAKRGITLDGFACAFGVNKTTVMRWEEGKIPAERVVEIERETGIPRHVLRPDLYRAGAAA